MCLKQTTMSKFIAMSQLFCSFCFFKFSGTSWEASRAVTCDLKSQLPFKYGGKTVEPVVICCISTTVSLTS